MAVSKENMQNDSTMSQADEEALDWFVRRADGLSAADEERFRQWLTAHPGHARAHARWQQDWQDLDALPADAVERLRQGLARPQSQPESQPESQPARSAPPSAIPWRHRFAAWFAPPRTVAAGVALVLACGVAGVLWWQPVASSLHATAPGQRLDTMLADGSRLQLAPASRAAVELYRARREIALAAGQARFEISKDPGRPLTVQAGALRITVVGTRFTVRHGAGPHGGVRVAVEEGHVRVVRTGWLPWSGSSVDLVAGQAIGSDADGGLGAVSAVRPDDLAPWHERRMSFDNATLAQVLAAFARQGDTSLVVRDPAVAALRVTGTFDLLRPDRFAQLLPKALPVRVTNAGDSIEIRAR